MKRPVVRNSIVMVTFIFVLSIFIISAKMEYDRSIAEQKQILFSQIQILTAQVDNLVNQGIRNVMGVISLIQTKPDITQEDLNEFSKNLIPEDDRVIRHFAILEDTTITMVYPFETNESAVGVDLAKIEAQKDAILKVKNDGVYLFTGPVELVQGGKALINRAPIYLNPNTINQTYWGQMALVIWYDPIIRESGILEFSKTHIIKIEQIGDRQESESIIFSNSDKFSDDAVEAIINVPNGIWKITAEFPGGIVGSTPLYYLIVFMGVMFGMLTALFVNTLLRSNADLNRLVDHRTSRLNEVNHKLEYSLDELKRTQDQLIMSEKLAALGELVAGVAHEINTPLGICITLNSFVDQNIESFESKFTEGKLKRSDLKLLLSEVKESSQRLTYNLNRAAKLVESFKKVATDQNLEECRIIDLSNYIEDVVQNILPKFKKTSHKVDIEILEEIKLATLPGALSQVISNIVLNSLVHGFIDMENGRVLIRISETHDSAIIDILDNGKGIDFEIRDKVFEPFTTTRKNKGSTGLGMHIVFNLVTHTLKGSIDLEDNQPQGVHWHIILPKGFKKD